MVPAELMSIQSQCELRLGSQISTCPAANVASLPLATACRAGAALWP